MAELKKFKGYLKSNTAKTLARFTGGNLLVILLGGISSFFYAKWIDPEVLGEFRKFSILTSYLGLGNIFIDAAYRRNFTYLFGKGEKEEALNTAAVCKWFYSFLTWVGVIVFGGLALRSLIMNDLQSMVGWLIQIPIFYAATFSNYLNPLFKSNQHFDSLNKSLIFTAVSGLFLLPFVYFFKFYGLAIRSVFQDIVKMKFLTSYAPYKIKSKFNWSELKRLAKISIPLQIPAALDAYVLSPSMSFFVLVMLGKYELGIYGMALTFLTILTTFSVSINQIFITKSTLQQGKHDSIAKAFSYIMRPTIYASIFMAVVIVVFVYSLDIFFIYYAPKYIDSVPVLSILAFEVLFKVLCAPFVIMTTALMYKPRIIIRLIKIVTIFAVLAVLPINIINIAWALVLGDFAHTVAGYVILYMAIKKEKKQVNHG